jgi:hypothetical protein
MTDPSAVPDAQSMTLPGQTRLPEPIESLLLAERRRENLMLANSLRQRASQAPLATLAHHSRAMVTGFVAGAAIVMPILLVLLVAPELFAPLAGVRDARNRPAKPEGPVLVSAPRPAERPEPAGDVEAAKALAQRLDLAQTRVARREILAAREILTHPEIAQQPEAMFALAETFDPNVLASLNVTHVSADAEQARRLYAQALAGGVETARQRLEALQ